MTRREDYEARTEALLLPLMEEFGFELVDVEYVKEGGSWYLRAYIDKEGGITVNDCEAVSRRMSDLLDEEDFIADSYIFEVSSPGLGRPLKKEKDYIRSMGSRVEIRTYRPIDRKKEFCGVLTAYTADTVTIAPEEGEEQTFEKNDIALIRLAFDF
ncbi:MAG: ribosome maturation factor RimP [Clostridiales bacterium]|nr:ribosome maturation factor RimP [Lachnospiraceae bacterium]MCD8323629.1 ribosome maturation factor RimP [Clostridiales bacterium]MCD8333017.1 ribosome maturation factor RimP [Clostridiales bacterium]